MMKDYRIRKVWRLRMPETNSSSSHAICISTGPDLIMPGDPRFNLEIRNNILILPTYKSKERFGGSTFGQASDKYNDPLTKLQYICGYYCTSLDGQGQKKITKLKRYLRRYLGIKDIIFKWDIEYFLRLSELKKAHPEYTTSDLEDEVWRNNPEVDHESCDLFEEINESYESFKNFVFNSKTWLYLSGDGCSGYYSESWIKEDEEVEPDFLFSLHFDGYKNAFGDRIDFEIPSIRDLGVLTSRFRIEFSFAESSLLDRIVYDVKDKEFRLASDEEYNRPSYPYLVKKPDNPKTEMVKREEPVKTEILSFSQNYLGHTDTQFYFCFMGEKLREYYLKWQQEKREKENIRVVNNLESSEAIDRLIKEHPKALKEGRDYVKLPLSIISTKFGKLI